MSHSVLDRVQRSDIRYEPYPHLVVENCLPEDYYRELVEAYPSDDLILELDGWRHRETRQNQRNDIAAAKALEFEQCIALVWMDFIRLHTSPAFYARVIELLGPEIRSVYPQLEKRIGRRLEDCRTGVRFAPGLDSGEISLDCQVGINTPVVRQSSVRRVHTDAVDELFAMLLYFRREEDDSCGGDLEIYRWKEGRKRLFHREEVDEDDAEYVGSIPYRPNTLVVFINSEHSLHAVSERSVTPHSRRLVNIIGRVYRSVPRGLFVKRQRTPAPSTISRLARRLARVFG